MGAPRTPTVSPSDALYISEADVARMLGRSTDWLRENRADLETQFSFPPIDQAVGKRHREAVEEWARERNVRSRQRPERLNGTNRENPHAF